MSVPEPASSVLVLEPQPRQKFLVLVQQKLPFRVVHSSLFPPDTCDWEPIGTPLASLKREQVSLSPTDQAELPSNGSDSLMAAGGQML